MKSRKPKTINLLQNLAKRTTVVIGLVIGIVILLTITIPSTVHAAGGAGGGGTGTGGAGGHQTSNGFGWAKYSSSGGGPTDGFKEGGWYGPGGPSETCQGAGADSVLVAIILNNPPSLGGTARGYNYLTISDTYWNSNENPLNPTKTYGQIWDNGKATIVPKADAEAAFNSLTPAEQGGLIFGSNVSWVCYDTTPTPTTYDGTIQSAKYMQGDTPGGGFGNVTSVVNGARFGIANSGGEFANSSNNPWTKDGIWVNPGNHESNTQGNYSVYVDVPQGWRVTGVQKDGESEPRDNSFPFSCDGDRNTGRCTAAGVQVRDGVTTYIDFFFAPNIEGSLDGVCPTNFPTANGDYSQNGKAFGWVIDYNFDQDKNNKDVTPSNVHIYISNPDGSNEKGYPGIRADQERPDLPANTGGRIGKWHGFSFVIPDEYLNGNTYKLKVFPVRNGQGIGNPPYLLGEKNFSCPPPTGDVRCLPFSESGDGIDYIQGWAFDPRKTQGPSYVHIYVDSTPGNTSDPDAKYNNGSVFGSIKLTASEIIARKNEGYRGVDENGLYRFKVAIPDALHDGENHIIRVYQITEDPASNPELKYVLPPGPYIEIGPNKCGSGGIQKWYWPWLQTQNGDVIARGSITGQLTADPQPNNNDRPGARLTSAKDKESEYLIISMLGGGNPFCSTYDYILTNLAATTGDCKNGTGYGTLSLYNLTDSSGDTVFNELVSTFNSNGGGTSPANIKCNPFNTQIGLPANLDTGQGAGLCKNGTIYKFNNDTLNSFSNISGRNTIFRDGNLKISGNITIPSDNFSSVDPRLQPNLAIVVNGDVYIDKSVTRLDTAIYATGKIYTCSNGSPTPFEQCNQQLIVNGMLASKKGYDFRRTFANDSRQPAELIRLSGQTVAFPPPGLSNLISKDGSNDVKIDTSEYQPRF